MKAVRPIPSFAGLQPASERSRRAAKGSSKKTDTKCELALRRELWKRGLRYRVDVGFLPGRPDIVFTRKKVVVFCDGDFWHGRDLTARLTRLARGNNGDYWSAKILGNVKRDASNTRRLRRAGWSVIRVWERDILRDVDTVANRIARHLGVR